ncbi:hypothetical protein VTJ83DRAFT_5483 [Remersonia thermophila]|uniref:DNA replication ATP-dependent helicase/nuclease n=1 Tax=Remersonia thermophila TaxID=72144 RepID=A0ABR4D721_9PEZI
MALKKSLSETKRPQHRQQWQRSLSNPAPQPPPPLPVSEKTKSKLHAFQFTEAPAKAAAETTAKDPSLPAPASDHPEETPAARPPWQNLFTKPEAAREDHDLSPVQRISWRNDIANAGPIATSPLLPRTGRKRARSSSPVGSSPAKHATPADLKKMVQVLRTPRADPARDLWDRFSVPGAASPSGLTNPLLDQLLVSSPRPRDGSVLGSGRRLKKSASCGANWPKRRKMMERADSDLREVAAADSRPDSKSSMVSALLETVNGEISKAKPPRPTSPQKPSSQPTSPAARDSSSPLAKKSSAAKADTRSPRGKPSSDYDDFDFDDETLLELDANMFRQGDDSTMVASSEDAHAQPAPPPKPAAAVDDEFADLDDDFFDDAENLMAEIESQYQSQAPAKQPAKPADGWEDGDDPYGVDDFDDSDLAAVEMTAPSAPGPFPTNPSQKSKAIQRYLITNVLETVYTDDRGLEFPEKILVVQAERTKIMRTVHLRGDWVDTPASSKAYVHVIGEFEPCGRCVIDNSRNILILHPDQLVSSTVVADSFTCMRRAVLQDRVKAASEATPPLVYGTILHEVFQEALMANRWDTAFLGSVVNRTLRKHIEDLYIIRETLEKAQAHVMSKMPELTSWAQAFVAATPKPNAFVQGKNGEKVNMCVSKLLDVEEHVWSPMYGLKGNIDATVQVTMRDGSKSKTLTVPFEVKTGRNATANHQAQTVLYNLLLSDRYDLEIVYGILYYMETSQTLRIPTIRNELRHMIMQRNRLACYIRERSVQLPPMKKSESACGRCYAQASCFTYHKLADNGDGQTSGLKDKFDRLVKHLTPTHRDFFLKWEDLLTKEEKETQKLRRELWTMVSTEREKLGRCFANVVIEEGSAHEDKHQSKINRFSYTFVKEDAPPNFSFLESQLTVGEPIVVSDEDGHFALALGYVTSVKKNRISVAVDRRLHNARIRQPGFDEHDNQVFASIMEVAPEGAGPEESQGKIREKPIRYRLDKDEFSNGMATVRNNLVQIMADGPFGSAQIRRLVVDLEGPRFKTTPTQYTVAGKDTLNVDQKAAVEKVMSAMDYALVLGMPGTGKTTTIAHIIRALVGQGKTLLLTSYTHNAVDNILLKLRDDNIPILRLGAAAKVHPEVRKFATLASQPFDSFEEIRSAWHDTPIVATTCLGVNHPIFNERTFDYCVVDEASQITLPICLGPIRMAKTFVLVGDHNQLPPLVQSEEARLGGLDVSLFKLLSDTHPQSVVNLEHQYRMAEDIMTLSNVLIYNGRLKCGTEALRTAQLDIPNMGALRTRHFDAASFLQAQQQLPQASSPARPASFCPGPRPGTCWLADLVDPHARVRFVNTDPLLPMSREEAKGNRIVNPCEAHIVAQLVDSFLAVGVPAHEIGVVTHYRSQLALLKHTLRSFRGGASSSLHHNPRGTHGWDASGMADVELHTADRFQGRDKSVVILSLVRSNEPCAIGELLRDWRRINVAFTRAKTKLLVVGSRSTLGGCGEGEMLARFVGLMEEKDWVYDLKPGALDGHRWDDGLSVVTASAMSSGVAEASSPCKGRGKPVAQGSGGEGAEMEVESFGATKPPALGGKVGAGSGWKENDMGRGKENRPLRAAAGTGAKSLENGGRKMEPKKVARIGERALLRGKPVLRDILNDMMDGGY